VPFENHLDMQGDDAFARVWRAQMPQLALPYLGLPGLTVSTGLLGRTPSVCRSFRDATVRLCLPQQKQSRQRRTALACRPANRLTLRRNVTQVR